MANGRLLIALLSIAFTAIGQTQGCWYEIDLADSGIITSPGYPNNYSLGITCTWILRPPRLEREYTFEITPTDIDFIDDSCRGDSLSILKKSRFNDQPVEVETLCRRPSDYKTITVLSSPEVVVIVFTSNSFKPARGFRLKYHLRTLAEYCGHTEISTPKQQIVIQSRNFPYGYPSTDNDACTWRFSIAYSGVDHKRNFRHTSKLLIRILVFSINNYQDSWHTRDTVTVGDSGSYSGKYGPNSFAWLINVDDNIKFRSFRGSSSDKGIKLLATPVPDCGGEWTIPDNLSEGVIEAPIIGDPYPKYVSCSWRLKAADPERRIHLVSSLVNIHSDDELVVKTSYYSPFSRKHRFGRTKNVRSNDVSEVGVQHSIDMKFRRSNGGSGNRFKFSFKTCGGTITFPKDRQNITLTSLNYPEPYPEGSICIWKIVLDNSTDMENYDIEVDVDVLGFNADESTSDCDDAVLSVQDQWEIKNKIEFCGNGSVRGRRFRPPYITVDFQSRVKNPGNGFQLVMRRIERRKDECVKYILAGKELPTGNVSDSQFEGTCSQVFWYFSIAPFEYSIRLLLKILDIDADHKVTMQEKYLQSNWSVTHFINKTMIGSQIWTLPLSDYILLSSNLTQRNRKILIHYQAIEMHSCYSTISLLDANASVKLFHRGDGYCNREIRTRESAVDPENPEIERFQLLYVTLDLLKLTSRNCFRNVFKVDYEDGVCDPKYTGRTWLSSDEDIKVKTYVGDYVLNDIRYHVTSVNNCGFKWKIGNTTDTGVIEGPTFSGLYPAGVNCNWYLDLHEWSKGLIVLRLETLDIDEDEQCQGDAISIESEVRTGSKTLDYKFKLCKRPLNLSSWYVYGSSFKINFVTRNWTLTRARKFRFHFQVHHDFIQLTKSKPTATIQSISPPDMYPETSYPAMVWTISAKNYRLPNNSHIIAYDSLELELVYLKLDAQQDCTKSLFQITDDWTQPIIKFCGGSLSIPKWRISVPKIRVEFKAPYTNGRVGFKLIVRNIPRGSEKNFNAAKVIYWM